MTYCMVIDLKRCVGCYGCSSVCKQANGTPPGVQRAKVLKAVEGTYPNVERVVRPMLCMHCDNPPCGTGCPTGATSKREEDGIVVVDKSECIGCDECIKACPYGARYHISETEMGYYGELTPYEVLAYAAMPEGTVDKCDFCLSRTLEGQRPEPACVAACVTGARIFGTVEELDEMIGGRESFVLKEDEGTGPNVHYLTNMNLRS